MDQRRYTQLFAWTTTHDLQTLPFLAFQTITRTYIMVLPSKLFSVLHPSCRSSKPRRVHSQDIKKIKGATPVTPLSSCNGGKDDPQYTFDTTNSYSQHSSGFNSNALYIIKLVKKIPTIYIFSCIPQENVPNSETSIAACPA